MLTLYMTKGLPASGKTTWAKQWLTEHPGACKRVNKDDLRAMLDAGKWSQDNEWFLLGIRDHVVLTALNAGKHVIVDDTNLAPKHQERLEQLAKFGKAEFKVMDFTDVDVEECVRRDQHRPNYVGERVIRDMYAQFLAPKTEPVVHDPSLPYCIIVDIDGTVAKMNGRSPFDWSRVGEDKPNESVCSLVRDTVEDETIFVSGRDECCREATQAWLNSQLLGGSPLFMRPAGDQRDDRIIKREIYEREIKGKYNVRFVLDDRNKVVAMWRELGLPCFQVAEGNF